IYPEIIISLYGDSTGCINQEKKYSISSSSDIQYSWIVKGGKILYNDSQNVTVRWTSVSDSNKVIFHATNFLGCDTEAVLKVKIIKIIESTGDGIRINNRNGLTFDIQPDDTIHFTNFIWQLSDGFTTSKAKFLHTFTTPGLYTANLSGFCTNGCQFNISD